MADMVILEAQIGVDVDRRLDEIAASQGIGKAELVADLLRDFVQDDPEYAAFVEEGLRDVREGRVVRHSDVVTAFKKRFGPVG